MPRGTPCQTVRQSDLAGWANYGYCGAFPLVFGLKLYLLITAEGMPVAWCLADAKLGERNVVTERLARAGRAAKA